MGRTGDQDSDGVASDFQNGHDSDIQTEESKKKHKCHYPDCRAAYSRPYRLEMHIRLHTGERPCKCKHPGCTKTYSNPSHLKRHVKTHNPIKQLYKCTECSLSLRHSHNLKRHYKRMHSEGRKISCNECGETFNKKYRCADHQTVHSKQPVIYKCDKCPQSYVDRGRFNRHRRTHEKRYPCPVSGCSEVFDKLPLLCAHRKEKHSDYKCETCGKTFHIKYLFRLHCKIHSEDRMILPCPYDKCPKFYFFKYALDEHVKIRHLGEKFYCDICSRGLTSKQRLIEHIQRHCEPKKRKDRVQQKRRKDAGVLKKSALSTLIGLNLPQHLEKMIMTRETSVNDTAMTSEAS